MTVEEQMTCDERRKYLRKMWPLYLAADRAGRSRLLDEMEHVTGMHRKSLLRLLHSRLLERKQRTTPRSRSYGLDVQRVVSVVWEALDYPCAERLKPGLLPTARHLQRFGELSLEPVVEAQLSTISLSTLRRMTARIRRPTPKLPRKGPQEANRIRKGVPMGRISWDTGEPGHFETDLVHHCGAAAVGDYVHTLQLVDVGICWSERVAVYGRSQRAMEAAFRHVLHRLPYPIQQLHPDNGSEFFNAHLVRFFGENITGLKLSRSRPYQKNDNPRVEQKNHTLVRMYLGDVRLDSPQQAEALNEIYELMWLYYNFFQPVMHLVEKRYEDGKLSRVWDEPKTPYERLKETGVLSAEQIEHYDRLYEQTNPRVLRERIYQQLSQLWELTRNQAAEPAA